jgi:hypothetical protein
MARGDSLYVVDREYAPITVFSPDLRVARVVQMRTGQITSMVPFPEGIVLGWYPSEDTSSSPVTMLRREGGERPIERDGPDNKAQPLLSGSRLVTRGGNRSVWSFPWNPARICQIDLSGKVRRCLVRDAPGFRDRIRDGESSDRSPPPPELTSVMEDTTTGYLWTAVARPVANWGLAATKTDRRANLRGLDWRDAALESHVEVIDLRARHILASLVIRGFSGSFLGGGYFSVMRMTREDELVVDIYLLSFRRR